MPVLSVVHPLAGQARCPKPLETAIRIMLGSCASAEDMFSTYVAWASSPCHAGRERFVLYKSWVKASRSQSKSSRGLQSRGFIDRNIRDIG
jgi:hypothetical protein